MSGVFHSGAGAGAGPGGDELPSLPTLRQASLAARQTNNLNQRNIPSSQFGFDVSLETSNVPWIFCGYFSENKLLIHGLSYTFIA